MGEIGEDIFSQSLELKVDSTSFSGDELMKGIEDANGELDIWELKRKRRRRVHTTARRWLDL